MLNRVNAVISALKLHIDELQCQLKFTQCQYVCRKLKIMIDHLKQKHNWTQQQRKTMSVEKAQKNNNSRHESQYIVNDFSIVDKNFSFLLLNSSVRVRKNRRHVKHKTLFSCDNKSAIWWLKHEKSSTKKKRESSQKMKRAKWIHNLSERIDFDIWLNWIERSWAKTSSNSMKSTNSLSNEFEVS